MFRKFILSGISVLFFFHAMAQTNTRIAGHISAEDGRAAAMVTVTIKELKVQTVSDDNGDFSIRNILPGNYLLTATLIGCEPISQEITVKEGETTRVDLVCRANAHQLQTVAVTAEKRENVLQQVPMSVSAIAGKTVEERKIRELGDMLLSVPNLMTMNIGAPTLSTVAIRGVLTFSTDPAVGVYVDGVPMFDGYSSSMQLQNIERVEVLRGPQSTLYGRNALGGIINIITRKPDNTLHGFAEAGLSNYGGNRYALGLSGPLVQHKLFAGFSGLFDTRKGYYTNLYNNSKFDLPETYNGNFYLKYLASDRFSVVLNGKGEYNHIRGTFPYVVSAESAFGNPYTVNQNGANRETRKLYTASLTALYKVRSTEFSSISAFTSLDDDYRDYDVDYSPYNIMNFETPLQRQQTFTQEFKMTGDYGKRLKVTAGVFGFIDTKPSQTVYEYGPDAASMDPNAPYTSNIYGKRKIHGIAGYATVNYLLTDQLSVTAGLRYDYETRDLTFSTDFVKDPEPPVIVAPERKIEGSNHAFSPKVSLNYQVSGDVLVYASYARGYRAGGFNQYSTDVSRLNYRPEYTDNFELGLKSEWLDHRIRANAALFYTNWKDQQQTLSLPENATENVGKLINKGAELELTALLAKGLELNYNLGLVHSDYRSLILPDASGVNQNYVGNKQVFTPAFTSAVALTYRHAFNNKTSVFITPEWKYMGKQYMTYYNDLEQDPFSLVNASAGIQFGHIELDIWSKNIGDALYLAFAYATQPGATTPVLLGIPRTYGVTLKTRF